MMDSKKSKKLISLATFLIFLLFSASIFAQEKEVEEMTLEELLSIEITTVSKKAERIQESPGIISVITAEDIKRMGYETLNDIIKTVPGVTITESFFGYTSPSFRGIKETHYNNRTLLLLNGAPLREATVGTYFLEAIPINVIERIEIIRGPGSIVYGAGAFAGVINLITKDKVNLSEISALTGSKSTISGFATYGRIKENYSYLAGLSYNDSDGYKATVKDEAGETAQLGYYEKDKDAYENDYYNFFTNFSQGDIKVDFYHFKQEKDKFGIIPNHLTTGEVESKASGLALSYQKEIKGVELKSLAYYSQSSYNGYMNLFPPIVGVGNPIEMEYSGNRFGVNVDGGKELSKKVSILSGVSFEIEKTDPYKFIDANTGAISGFTAFLKEYDTNDFSIYSQIEFVPIDSLKILGGMRYNKNKDYGDTSVPRVSAVFKAKENLFLKALYGSAYRNPSFFEKYVNTKNVLYGDPDLKPEKINTFELGIDWLIKNNSLRLTLFNTSTDDMIGRVKTYLAGETPAVQVLENRTPDTTPTADTPGYGNAEGQKIQGIEFEAKGVLPERNLSYTFNLSYKDGEEKAGTKPPVQYLDKVSTNAILTHTIGKFKNSLSLNYVGERKGNIGSAGLGAAPGFTVGQNITIPAYTLVNLKTSYKINENMELNLIGLNIFKESYSYPEYIRTRIDDIPGDSGRNIYGQIIYKF